MKSYFESPEDFETTLLIVSIVFTFLMLIAVLIRVYVRATIHKQFGWDDYTCFAGAICSLSQCVIVTQSVRLGVGDYLWTSPEKRLVDDSHHRLFMSNTITNPVILFLTRVSILLLYMRIFKVDRILRAAIYLGFLLTTAFYITALGFGIRAIIECVGPLWFTKKLCEIVQLPLYTALFSFNIAMEIYLMILPVSRILKLQLSLRRKIGLCIVFASGFLTLAASMACLILFTNREDEQYISQRQALTAIFQKIEINVALIIACMPCFPSFFLRFRTVSGKAYSSIRPLVDTLRKRSHRFVTQSDRSPGSTIDEKQSGIRSSFSSNKTRRKGSTVKHIGIPFMSNKAQQLNEDAETNFDVERHQQHDYPYQGDHQQHKLAAWQDGQPARGQPEIVKTTEYKVERMLAAP